MVLANLPVSFQKPHEIPPSWLFFDPLDIYGPSARIPQKEWHPMWKSPKQARQKTRHQILEQNDVSDLQALYTLWADIQRLHPLCLKLSKINFSGLTSMNFWPSLIINIGTSTSSFYGNTITIHGSNVMDIVGNRPGHLFLKIKNLELQGWNLGPSYCTADTLSLSYGLDIAALRIAGGLLPIIRHQTGTDSSDV